jgi:hypothetical protein
MYDRNTMSGKHKKNSTDQPDDLARREAVIDWISERKGMQEPTEPG